MPHLQKREKLITICTIKDIFLSQVALAGQLVRGLTKYRRSPQIWQKLQKIKEDTRKEEHDIQH